MADFEAPMKRIFRAQYMLAYGTDDTGSKMMNRWRAVSRWGHRYVSTNRMGFGWSYLTDQPFSCSWTTSWPVSRRRESP